MFVKFAGHTVRVVKSEYANPRNTALQLKTKNGESFATASTNPPFQLEAGLVAVKDYSENTGMLEALRKAGVVGELVSTYKSGFVVIPVVKLLI